MELRERKHVRLPEWDYGRAGGYFVTVCTRGRENFFWDFISARRVGADIIRPHIPVLSQYGNFVEEAIRDIPCHYENVMVDKYVIMPNHVHMILFLTETRGPSGQTAPRGLPVAVSAPEEECGRMISAPTKGLSTIVGQMKRIVSKRAEFPIWQKSFHDHIIRGDADYQRIRHYIDTNPARWREDCYYIPPKDVTT